MQEKEQRFGKFYLKWPWNLVIYIILILLLRILAIPIILLLMAWNKKQQPDGPEEGYCLQRTRQRLARLVWAALFLLFGAGCAVAFVVKMMEDRSGWEIMDYAKAVVIAAAGAASVIGGLYEGYTDIRDALFPAKSRLARSIRSQLPYPDGAPGVKELFAMVDKDIRENGQWFDRVAVGKEWVFGDDVSSISRIRAVFGRDEIVRRHSNGRTQTTRIIELYIIDDRRQVQISDLRNPAELEALLKCLRLRAPEALFLPYSKYLDYCGKTDEEWQQLELEFRRRRAGRDERTAEAERASVQSRPDFVLTDLQGQRTSRFSSATIRELTRSLQEQGQRFALEPTEPIPAGSMGKLVRMECGITNVGITLIAVLRQSDNTFRACALCSQTEDGTDLLAVLIGLMESRTLPDLSVWQPLQAAAGSSQPPDPRYSLTLTDRTGVCRDYTNIIRRDVELAGEGLADGKYSTVILTVGPRYLYLKAGTKKDGRVMVNACIPESTGLQVYETKCTDRQAQTWLLELADGKFSLDHGQWKNVTKKLQKEIERKNKNAERKNKK